MDELLCRRSAVRDLLVPGCCNPLAPRLRFEDFSHCTGDYFCTGIFTAMASADFGNHPLNIHREDTHWNNLFLVGFSPLCGRVLHRVGLFILIEAKGHRVFIRLVNQYFKIRLGSVLACLIHKPQRSLKRRSEAGNRRPE